jgi:molybdenum cofactor cytidylyltransferase
VTARGPSPERIGIVLAAGRGRRMGRTKQLMPWPAASPASARGTVVTSAFDAIAPICASMIVVVGHEAGAVIASLAPRAFGVVPADADAEMLESIRAGIAAALARSPEASVVIHPADHPAVAAPTIALLAAAHAREPARAHMPEHGGRGGHPVIIPAAIARMILSERVAGGLRAFWASHRERCRRHEVADPGVVRDLDHPGDYQPAGEEA